MRRLDFSPSERRFRSRITQLAHQDWLIRGSLNERRHTCGKANCRCARGELHRSLYLVQSHEGKPRQVYVPKQWEQRVRRAVADYQEMQRLVEEVSELEWQRLKSRQR